MIFDHWRYEEINEPLPYSFCITFNLLTKMIHVRRRSQ